MNEQGLLLVISGPSGCGKDTIISRVLQIMGEKAFLSVSMTTRAMRAGEREGVDYYFVTPDEFRAQIAQNRMLEYAQYGENYYGTPVGPVENLLRQGKTVILNIEVTGGKNVRRLLPEAVEIFVAPPSLDELRRRLVLRGTETADQIESRITIAKAELACASEYDYIIVNDVLETAVEDVMAIIRASGLKTNYMLQTICEVEQNVES